MEGNVTPVLVELDDGSDSDPENDVMETNNSPRCLKRHEFWLCVN